ncbi:protein MpIDDL1 [Marchantia polymorpha subsp. ruderalis]|nr:hypothetical protein MARPO_0013s0172 [Marchantia polymorpha]BBN18867.1 hypothetical protein Mp_8g06180 [Marchantia polymorpha subsp. ruderalis]|eukprot:PTQ45977.1 hypothetical protein MARPO_0013s0172 [Marchantia polymorpha]
MPNMAVSTTVLEAHASTRDSALHKQNTPPLPPMPLSCASFQGMEREFGDYPLMPTVSPALLQLSGNRNLSPTLSHYKMPASGFNSMNPVSTPVMHPNLVMTLKSIISPSPDMCDQATKVAETLKGVEGYGQQQQQQQQSSDMDSVLTSSLYSSGTPPSVLKQEVFPPGEVDDDEAAVVSVDLIQNRRPFKCGFGSCNKTFKNPQTMKMHHKTHYSDDSSYRFGTNPHVLSTVPSAYKAGHNKKIPSRCPICKKTFVGLYELRRHFGRKHSEGEKTFACKKCGKKFYIEVDLRDHEKLCGEPIECKCGMKFAFKCNLVAHKKGHPECQDHPPSAEEDQQQLKQQQEGKGVVAPSTPSESPRSTRDLYSMRHNPRSATRYRMGTVFPNPSPFHNPMHDLFFNQTKLDIMANESSQTTLPELPLMFSDNQLKDVAKVTPQQFSSQSSLGDSSLVPSKPYFQSKGASTIVNPLSSQSSPGSLYRQNYLF